MKVLEKVLEKCSSIAKYERFAKSIANFKVLQKVLWTKF